MTLFKNDFTQFYTFNVQNLDELNSNINLQIKQKQLLKVSSEFIRGIETIEIKIDDSNEKKIKKNLNFCYFSIEQIGKVIFYS
jgi:hypothetical protein